MSVMRVRQSELKQRDAGFTLVELVVAMLVIAIVLIAIITVQAKALTTNAESQARQESTAIANQAMEELRSMPWDYLKKGLYSGFVAASGGDPFVTGSTLTVNARSYPLRIGSTGSDQDLTNPWPPLFDGAGSNKQTLTSPSGNGDVFTLRTYVTADQAGNLNAVGLVVVTSWGKRGSGAAVQTVLTSTAYAPSTGCGDTQHAPYLAACQAQFEATASTSKISVSAVATSVDGSTTLPLLNGSPYYRMQMATGSSSARVASQQVSTATSVATLGGVLWDDNIDSTSPSAYGWTRGSTLYGNEASDDATTGAAPPNPADVGGLGANSTYGLSSGSFTLDVRSDDSRTGTARTRTTQACTTGLLFDITAGAPCGAGSVTGTGNAASMGLTVDGKTLSFANVGTSGLSDWAWAARFATVAGNSSVGCTTVTGGTSGCTSAGAQKSIGSVVVGGVNGDDWTGADDYLVKMTNYADSVSVQRGVGATAATPTWSRSGSISYFDGTGYSTFSLGADASSQKTIGPVTWSTSLATVTATGTIDVTGTFSNVLSSTDCKGTDGCSVSAGNGWVQVTISYDIQPTTASTFTPWTMTVITNVNGSQAAALFKESPNA